MSNFIFVGYILFKSNMIIDQWNNVSEIWLQQKEETLLLLILISI